MRKWTVSSALLLSLLCLLGDQGRQLHATGEGDCDALVNPSKVEEKIGTVQHGLSTDYDVVKREAESISKGSQHSNAEKFEFQAEVSQLIYIIVNSIYGSHAFFLGVLKSNFSDALDKIKFFSLTNKRDLDEGYNAKLEVRIKLDKEKNILSIRDRGIGMTKGDLIKNLGTISKSATSDFVKKKQTSSDLNLFGRFGVGFYYVYLVANYVEVISKHDDDKQHVWESKADGAFEISEDTWNEPLGRGTEIKLHLREGVEKFLDEFKLKDLVKKYSEFMILPIFLWTTKEVSTDDESSESSSFYGEQEEDTEKEGEEKRSKTKVTETTNAWEFLNDVKAIWWRNPEDVTDEEYNKFYHSVAKDFSEENPLSWTHFTAEGDVEFKAVLFVPPKAPHDLYERYYNNESNLKLYVRSVFISDEFNDLLPKYLTFLKGIVDSDTLPWSVSRELQQLGNLQILKKKLIRKALDMIHKLVDEDPDESSDKGKKEADVKKSSYDNEKRGQYTNFWNEFGKSIKLGIIEDADNRNRLAKLLRFESTKSDGKLTSLDQYISRMEPGQEDIYYIAGSSKEQLDTSPFLERLNKQNYEVILFSDPVDEYLMQYLMDCEDKKFQNVPKEDLELRKSYKELTKWWKDTLCSDNVDGVKISNRLGDTSCIVVKSKFGWSAYKDRIIQAQTSSDAKKQAYMRGKRVLEINPRHSIIKELRERFVKDPEDEKVKKMAQLMYETALLESGFTQDPKY